MIVHIMAGGPKQYIPQLDNYPKDICWIGVDRGVMYLIERSLPIYAAFGDFDSISETELQAMEEKTGIIKRFKPEKDETDMELALLWAIKEGATTIRLFGATGGRLDHTIANLHLLLREALDNKKIQLEIIDKQNSVSVVQAGSYTVKKLEEYKYISFFPYSTKIVGLSLEGFKYPLVRRNLPASSTLCISNELIRETGTFSFDEGILMVIRSCD
ncbi:thiamine diphosphokinase [Niallia circulans]|jgi:thiamine pyrophosphokinase|uniref:Thiamine diphosphokinase n=1 Tax=Niallia circulans TaxID=1397 RepID=A0A0J1IQK4_NIACI|nr:thiamine diphosphokinase [Niallia circulans]KLV28256.1 thiamine pyrophosphokinase [Niallia circulans]MCM2979743.1 thiamine diphosphokinase [Niallia circulans]MDR4315643.1 thiamine diphosphokinase [Niallia circulans]MED3837111.1 thiamine diphosphokinase [Niallia circulans]MED4244181.1 thiamine diphosphokinase [Niallia circulans]